MSKNKHYSTVEKKIFLEILKDFKHVIEVKKSDCSTLRDKEVAWFEICKLYNESTMISQERTVQQLKKLWANMKQTQRDALTKEKQSILATGGGPSLVETNIDPDIAIVTPHLMETAPVIFSSNMTENETLEKEKQVINALQYGNVTNIDNILYDNYDNDESSIMTKKTGEIISAVEENRTIQVEEASDKENQNIYEGYQECSTKRKKNWNTGNLRTPKLMKEKNTGTFVTEDDIKIERIKHIIEQEKDMADIRKTHEERITKEKEEFYIKLHALEIRAAIAKAELAELQLQKEKKKYEEDFI